MKGNDFMKTTKRFLSIMLIAMMTFCLSAFTVSAEEYSITVGNDTNGISIDGQTFNAYKVFAVTYDGDAYTYGLDNECLSPGGYGDSYSIDKLQDFTKDQMQAFGDYVYNTYVKNGATAAGSATATGGSAVIKVDKPGYYLVFGAGDNDNGANGKKAVTSLVMCDTASPNASVNLKLDAPSLDKEIKHNETGAWGVVGDNQIGDDVEFRLITKVPSINGYSKYDYIIHDTMTTGLTYKELVAVKVNDETVLPATYYTASGSGQNLTVTVNIKDAISDGVISANDMLYTYYNATLNTNALVATNSPDETNHNDNEAYLEYSNNPYDDTSHGETPHVKVYDWTFAATIHKVGVSESGTHNLPGAGFTITDEDGNTVRFTGTGTEYTVDPNGGVTEIITPNDGIFTIKGLDDTVTYTLEETTVPNGYSKCENVTITLSADYTNTTKGGGDVLQTLSLSATGVKDGAVSGMTVTIENTSGKKLVGTGGIGTTIFYIAGGVLMAGAVVLLIVKRRVNK